MTTLNDTQGITFNVITMRIRVHTLEKHHSGVASSDRVRTIGSIPLRRIHVDIAQDVEFADDKTILPHP